MFEENDIIYTDKDVWASESQIAFTAFKAYEVYLVEVDDNKPKELVLVNEMGMLHPMKSVAEYFNYQH